MSDISPTAAADGRDGNASPAVIRKFRCNTCGKRFTKGEHLTVRNIELALTLVYVLCADLFSRDMYGVVRNHLRTLTSYAC
jgi:hypothetical protein